MRLYLSSFKLGNYPEKLVELVGAGKSAALILNALDNFQETRDRFLLDQAEDLRKLGLSVQELDLRKYFGKQNELEIFLQDKNVVWICGGNTFILRRAMKQSGFDTIIKKLVEQDVLVYGGFSAAVCVASSHLRGLELVDNPNDVPLGYDSEIIWDGLGLIDFSVAVHYKSNHSESHLVDNEVEYYQRNHIPYKTLRDGEVLIKKGEDLQIFG